MRNSKAVFEMAAWRCWLPYAPSTEVVIQAPEQVIVAEGDSLSRIAIRKGIAVEAMIAANPQLSDPMRLYPGDTVNLPKAAAAPAE